MGKLEQLARYPFRITSVSRRILMKPPASFLLRQCVLFLLALASSGQMALGFDPAPPKLNVMTWNVEWMFDDNPSDNRSDLAREQSSPSKEYWQWKVSAVANAISKCGASIVALQEIEGDQTLADIAAALRASHNVSYRYVFIQGSDRFTEQDVGLLYRSGLVEYRRHEQSREMFESERYYNLSKHLVGVFQWKNVASPLTVMTAHFRATEEAEALRVRQARLARFWLAPHLDKGGDVILLGDLNTERWVGDESFEMAVLTRGDGTDSKDTPLVDLLKHAAPESRRTHLILDDQFDRILASPSMTVDDPANQDWVFEKIVTRPDLVIRGAGADGKAHWDQRLTMPTLELDVSDHYPVVATFLLR